MSALTLRGRVGECQSRTKSKDWEKRGRTALMPVEAFIFTQDFCNF